MKFLKKEQKSKIRLTSVLSITLLMSNVVCGFFIPIGYYYIGFALGGLALLLLTKYVISDLKKLCLNQAKKKERWEREEKEFESILNQVKKEVDAAVENQLREHYEKQLKKVIYNVLLDKNIMNATIAKKIMQKLLANKNEDFITDEKLYLRVEKELNEMNIIRKVS